MVNQCTNARRTVEATLFKSTNEKGLEESGLKGHIKGPVEATLFKPTNERTYFNLIYNLTMRSD
jgi:hypothetical protein